MTNNIEIYLPNRPRIFFLTKNDNFYPSFHWKKLKVAKKKEWKENVPFSLLIMNKKAFLDNMYALDPLHLEWLAIFIDF